MTSSVPSASAIGAASPHASAPSLGARVARAGLWMRLGVGQQLSIGFVAVAILAITANVILQSDRPAVRTRTERIAPEPGPAAPLPAVVADAASAPRAGATAPLADSSRTSSAAPARARSARPPAGALPAAPSPDALLDALAGFESNVRAIAAAPSFESNGPYDTGEAAQFAVDAAVERFMRQPATARVDAGVLDELRKALLAHQFTGREIARSASRRRDLLSEYLAQLDSIELLVRQPLDDSVKVFGRIFARDSVIALNQAADRLRQGFGDLVSTSPVTQPALDAMTEAESAFTAALDAGAPVIGRSLGAEWVTRLRAEFTDVVASRHALAKLDEAQAASLVRFEADSGRVADAVRGAAGRLAKKRAAAVAAAARARTAQSAASQPVPPEVASPQPAAAPPPAPAPVIRTVTERITTESATSYSLLWISAGVLLSLLLIGVATVLSVSVPVRRLTEATRRLAGGERDVAVPRGGARELDELGVAFNAMARQLAEARAGLEQQRTQLETQVAQRTRDLQHLAEHDPLTQLPNRRQLFAYLEAALVRASEDGTSVGVLFLDLDNFKIINDSLNHEFGDLVLQQLALRLAEAAAPAGFCARLGGDEFTIVHEGIGSQAQLAALANRVVDAFAQPLRIGEQEIKITVSVGVSAYPEHAAGAEGLLRAADTALFRAKENGRNQFVLFDAQMLEEAARRFTIEQGLHGAIERGELRLFYQPAVRLDGAAPSSAEALLRWHTADGRLVSPAEFLPVAEQSGLIVAIGDWVIHEAIRKASQWYRGEWPDVRIAVNVSARQLLDGRFVGRVADLLRQYDLPARCIEIELTETVLQTGPGTIAALRELRARGVSIALDDFGTGYSSLASLEKLPLTRVKLDRSLVSDIDRSARALAIAHAIIELCAGLGLEVTAEGVERQSQFALLTRERNVTIQGYLISRPLPESEWLQLLPLLPAAVAELTLTLPDFDDARAAPRSDEPGAAGGGARLASGSAGERRRRSR